MYNTVVIYVYMYIYIYIYITNVVTIDVYIYIYTYIYIYISTDTAHITLDTHDRHDTHDTHATRHYTRVVRDNFSACVCCALGRGAALSHVVLFAYVFYCISCLCCLRCLTRCLRGGNRTAPAHRGPLDAPRARRPSRARRCALRARAAGREGR